MPTPYDDFTGKAHSGYKHLPRKVLENRKLLQTIMTKHGFAVYPAEWWHFDFNRWKQYPVMDIFYEKLL